MDSARWEDLLKQQEELEDNSLAMGGERFRRRLDLAVSRSTATQHGAARRLLQEAIIPMEKALDARMVEQESRRGVVPLLCVWVPKVGADVAAYMTAKVCLDGVGRKVQLRKAAKQVSELILDELRYRRFQKEAPYLFQYKMDKFSTSNYRYKSRSLLDSLRYAEIDVSDLQLSSKEQMLLGTQLINVLVEVTGMLEVYSVKSPAYGASSNKGRAWKGETYLTPTAETSAWLNERNAALELMLPVAMPMVVSPLPWGTKQRGGYRYAMRGKYSLVRGQTKEQSGDIKAAIMPRVYAALNRIQETPWCINREVLALIADLQENRGGIAGIPELEPEPMPVKPADIDTNYDARKAWRRAASAAKDRNHRRHLVALEFTRTMAVARTMQDKDAIYFPFSLDFRGRVYPIGTYLHPQGADLAKSLLTFAEGKPLGWSGVYYLAVHGMNKLGDTPEGQKVSRMTLDERVSWVKAHEKQIRYVVDNPLHRLWWAEADKPLQFYAFCVEWVRSLDCPTGQDTYVSHLPVSLDGSCNGLQHFSAMLLDEVGGREVNLLPLDQPKDIYQAIANKVLDSLEQDAATNVLAAQWLASGVVDRKLAKRPTMTFGYGSKRYGFQEQLLAYLQAHENWKEVRKVFLYKDGDKEKNGVGAACHYMADLIWQALQTVVVAAFSGMEWMQQASKLACEEGACVRWTVPMTGFPVVQAYYQVKRSQVSTILAGKMVKPSVWTETQNVNRMKQANAISPNFIHSLDAAALMLTIELAGKEGISSFAMVHDSYGTHAADTEMFGIFTRQAFVRLYQENDVLALLAAQLLTQVPEKMREYFPDLPAKGSLDLGGVLVSEYFFA